VNIGQVAAASGASAKMIRHYEAIGLIRRAARSASGCRGYGPADVDTLRFVQRAGAAGFLLSEIGELVALWADRARPARGPRGSGPAQRKRGRERDSRAGMAVDAWRLRSPPEGRRAG